MTMTSIAPDGKLRWQHDIRANFGSPSIEVPERIQALPDGSVAVLAGAEDGCELIIAGQDQVERTALTDIDAHDSLCTHLAWIESRGTYVLDRHAQRGVRLHALG